MVANVEIKVLSTSSSSSLPNEQHQNDNSSTENDSMNNVRALSTKSESSMGRRVNAVVISAKANNSAPAILSTATNMLVQDFLRKASVAVSKTDSSDSATWEGFRDLFTTSFESIAKLGTTNESTEPLSPNAQRTQKSSNSNEKIANVVGGVSVTDVFSDAINMFTMNLMTNAPEELETVKGKVLSEEELKTKKSTFGARSFASVTRQEEYDSSDKLELRYAIAKANNFYEFVKLYSNGVGNNESAESSSAPSIPQMIKMAELLFKDYQHSVVHQLSDA